MAKKSSRQTFPFTCEHCGSQLWLETNTTNNRVKTESSKIKLQRYCDHVDCKTHRTFTQSKRPAAVQQGGKKKR